MIARWGELLHVHTQIVVDPMGFSELSNYGCLPGEAGGLPGFTSRSLLAKRALPKSRNILA